MYPGGKGSTYRQMVNLIPPHRVYIETHLGGGAVLKAKRPAEINIGIDLDRRVIHQTGVEVIQAVVNGSNGGVNPQGAIMANIAKNDDCRRDIPSSILPMLEKDLIVKNDVFYFLHGDCLRFLVNYPFTGNEFVYCDPPYLMETRRSGRPIYMFEYDDIDHLNLLSCLLSLPCPAMISGYWSEMYADVLTGWQIHSFQSQTRGGKPATEYLWYNYPPPTRLHDYRYLGDNFRERERIKRKKARWVAKFQNLDDLERRAILWAIEEAGIMQ